MPPTSFGAKRKRVSRACDRCHRLGRKCAPSPRNETCQSCIDYGDECTYDRPQGKRGAKGKRDDQLPLDHETILYLIDAYRVAIYGVYCFFSWPHFTADVRAKRYETDVGFRATILAVCAIASARIRDGAALSLGVGADKPEFDPESLHATALAAVPAFPLGRPATFDDLRASYLLCVLAMQNGDTGQSHAMMGRYFAFSSLLHFHDESRWPESLKPHERQELRCLYWSGFTHDVFLAALWGGMSRIRSWCSLVSYPDNIDDGSGDFGWITGWNTVTELYKVLEATMDYAAARNRAQPYHTLRLPDWAVVRASYDALPEVFKSAGAVSGNPDQDIYGFQLANLTCTLQALSAPVLQQLGDIGALLGSVVQSPLTVAGYLRIRQILLELASLLALLESTLKNPAKVSARVFDHVERIDAFMQQKTSGAEHDMLNHTISADGSVVAVDRTVTDDVAADSVDTLFTIPDDLLENWMFTPDQQMFFDAFRW